MKFKFVCCKITLFFSKPEKNPQTKMDSIWNRLCLHALARSVTYGNVLLQPMFASAQAFYFQSSEESDVQYYVSMANWHLFMFSVAGFFARTFILFFPQHETRTLLFGLVLWACGLCVFVFLPNIEHLSFGVYHGISISTVSLGGGIYYWASLGDVMLMSHTLYTKDLHSHQYGDVLHKIALIFGCFSTAYMYFGHWFYVQLLPFVGSNNGASFWFMQSFLFGVSFPVVVCLLVEEYNHPFVPDWHPNGNLRSEYDKIRKDQFVKKGDVNLPSHFGSFEIHLFFIVLFGIFKNIPPVTLYLNQHYSQQTNEELLFWRSLGMLLGESLFALLYTIVYLPSIAAIIMPIIIMDWQLNMDYVTRIYADVIIYGFCVGALNVWVFHRVAIQWLVLIEQEDGLYDRLNILLFMLSLASLPGDVLLNLTILYADSLASSSAILTPSFVMALATMFVICVHWFVYNLYENVQIIKNKNEQA